MAVLNDIDIKVSYVYIVLSVFAIAMLASLRKEKVLNSFNVSLLTGTISLIGYDIVQYFLTRYDNGELSSQTQALLEVVVDSCQALWALSYLYFSFVRSSTQLDAMFPWTYKLVSSCWAVPLSIFLIPVLLAVIKLINIDAFKASGKSEFFWYQCSQILCTITLAAFDTLFLVCFVRYLRRTQVDLSVPIDPAFVLISRYGMLASGACFLTVPLWSTNPYYWPFYLIETSAYSCLMNFVVAVLFAMKVSLRHMYDNVNSSHTSGGSRQTSKNPPSTI
ncbi:hypothetical protein BCR33DRAFT_719132 [Rhizoclosmatium globosum]|uniref:Uncharacterized protein n=1 Tax=Rhizoclosmatium globosum TaxID=329046 RepID=A0A1Y2C1Y9_9FUNG|nr:hypothetical protein BCR33DRAFT_719132 [Rhizoclosmatium globosum]|eukprot:ORY41040.1 hypothetical protein BCR33DRAFT_719132 [Rhizoclosmatium globosum]